MRAIMGFFKKKSSQENLGRIKNQPIYVWILLNITFSSAECEEGPGICALLMTAVSLFMILLSLPVSLIFVVKVVQVSQRPILLSRDLAWPYQSHLGKELCCLTFYFASIFSWSVSLLYNKNKLNQIKGINYWYGEKRISKLFHLPFAFMFMQNISPSSKALAFHIYCSH